MEKALIFIKIDFNIYYNYYLLCLYLLKIVLI